VLAWLRRHAQVKKLGMNKDKTISVSLGGTPLFLIFLVLKLIGVIDWSWWWVTCPLWLPTAIVLGLCAVFFGGALFVLGCAALFVAITER
jgi:hypothetical protein